jgi:carboxyl-terminal processing protease
MKLSVLRKIIFAIIIFTLGFGLGNKYGNYKLDLAWQSFRPMVAVSHRDTPSNISVDFQTFWTVWDKVSQKFVDRSKIQPQKMLDGAISGMMASLGDPYTVYLPVKQNTESKEDLQGSFEGIGAQLGLKGKNVIVIAPLADTPAERAGVRAGDHIYKVNDTIVDGKSLPEVVTLIRGPKGTKVKLTLKREGVKNEIVKEITRETIIVKSVTVSFKNDVAVIKLSRFGDRTDEEWMKTISEISRKGDKVKGVVLDMRNNPGGYLNGSVFVASEFLGSGKKVVTQESSIEGTKEYFVNRAGKLLNIPLVVLINKGSASASEIVAGTLRDNGRAKLVGEKTFGKGSVQEAEDLTDGAGLHITVAKWITPSGLWINGTGIKPDVEVKNDEKKPKEDKQLDKAMEILK